MAGNQAEVRISDDGESGELIHLPFKNRTLHRLLTDSPEADRPTIVGDALDLGSEVLARVAHHGDFEELGRAVDNLDRESKRIVESAVASVDGLVERTVAELAESLGASGGPLTPALEKFDPTKSGNVIDTFREVITETITRTTKTAVADLAEATSTQIASLTESIAILEKVAAVEEARIAEAERGTAKGLEHEAVVESLLGELAGVAGDSLDDVSTVPGLDGNKKGDKVITPRAGVAIVTEEKCTQRLTESKARGLLRAAMDNRGARLGMLIVEDESKVPGNQPYHLIDDDKVVVTSDRQSLRLVYTYFRAKAIEIAQAERRVDDAQALEVIVEIEGHVENLRRCLERFKLIRTEHTKATKAIGQAGGYTDEVATVITESVASISGLIDSVIETHEEAA